MATLHSKHRPSKNEESMMSALYLLLRSQRLVYYLLRWEVCGLVPSSLLLVSISITNQNSSNHVANHDQTQR